MAYDYLGLAALVPVSEDQERKYNTECESSLKIMLLDKDVKAITDKLDNAAETDSTCIYKPITCKCCLDKDRIPLGRHKGFGNAPGIGLDICSNEANTPEKMKEALMHELTHATQHCKKTRHLPYSKLKSTCEVALCNEMEAYSKEPVWQVKLKTPNSGDLFIAQMLQSIGEIRDHQWVITNPQCAKMSQHDLALIAKSIFEDCTGFKFQ